MTRIVCEACDTDFSPSHDTCPLCGKRVPEAETDSPTAEAGTMSADTTSKDTGFLARHPDVLYRLAIGFSVGYAVSGLGGLVFRNTLLFGIAVLAFSCSVIFLYLDLRALPVRLYGTRPVWWVIGAVLVYFLVVPIYIYKRGRSEWGARN